MESSSASRFYVLEVAVRGQPTRSALVSLFHVHFAIFKAYATSGGSALLLRPLGGDATNAGLLAVLSLAAIQLAAGSLPAETLRVLRSGLLGILACGGVASRAFVSAELLRRAADSGAAPEGGGVTEGMQRPPPAAGLRRGPQAYRAWPKKPRRGRA